jgi:fatty acid-binding protein DegV
MKKNIAILIDSSTTINEEFARLNDIHMVPMQLIDSNGKTYADDGKEITQKQLFQEIANNRIFKSSVTNLGLLMAKVEELFEQYENVIFLPISPELSGNYNQAVNLIKPEFKNFFVVKNNTIAVMTEYAIHKLIDLLKTNKIEDAIVKIEK